jgi:hypothetical protein
MRNENYLLSLTQTNYMLKWTGNENYLQASTQTKVKMDRKWKLFPTLTQTKVKMDRKWKLLTRFDSN